MVAAKLTRSLAVCATLGALLAAALPSAALRAQDIAGPLVLYTNDFEKIISPRFKADTGRDVEVIQMSGGELLARIAAERANPRWDLVIFNGSNALHSLDQEGQLLRGYQAKGVAALTPAAKALAPANASWQPIGLSASCVVVYRKDLVKQPPAGFADLVEPRFRGKLGMADPAVAAPAYPCVAQFFHAMGEQKAKAYFQSLFKNDMRIFRTNAPTGRALQSGEIEMALLTSQIGYTLKAGGAPVEILWPAEGAPASLRGAGIQAATKRPEGARVFIDWLLMPATQQHLAEKGGPDGLFEATVAGVERRADGPPAGMKYNVAPADFAAANEEAIKTWFADQAVK